MAENNLENMDIENMTQEEMKNLLRGLTVGKNQGAAVMFDETTSQSNPLQAQVQNTDGGYSL